MLSLASLDGGRAQSIAWLAVDLSPAGTMIRPDVVMTLDELRLSLRLTEPPPGLSPLLRALWLDGHGNWEGAHLLTQEVNAPEGAWVHAYLHRKEGDDDNAAYWYRRAARTPCTGDLVSEWESIARALLDG